MFLTNLAEERLYCRTNTSSYNRLKKKTNGRANLKRLFKILFCEMHERKRTQEFKELIMVCNMWVVNFQQPKREK